MFTLEDEITARCPFWAERYLLLHYTLVFFNSVSLQIALVYTSAEIKRVIFFLWLFLFYRMKILFKVAYFDSLMIYHPVMF